MMRKVLMVLFTLFASFFVYAEMLPDKSLEFQTIHWLSKNSSQDITIENGNDLSLVIMIHVDNGGAGVKLRNCGRTNHLDPGSSAMCSTMNSGNSIVITSDSNDLAATGTYEIQQKPY